MILYFSSGFGKLGFEECYTCKFPSQFVSIFFQVIIKNPCSSLKLPYRDNTPKFRIHRAFDTSSIFFNYSIDFSGGLILFNFLDLFKLLYLMSAWIALLVNIEILKSDHFHFVRKILPRMESYEMTPTSRSRLGWFTSKGLSVYCVIEALFGILCDGMYTIKSATSYWLNCWSMTRLHLMEAPSLLLWVLCVYVGGGGGLVLIG